MAFQERNLVHVALPSLTVLLLRVAPKPVPVMVTVTPRLPDVGDSLAR